MRRAFADLPNFRTKIGAYLRRQILREHAVIDDATDAVRRRLRHARSQPGERIACLDTQAACRNEVERGLDAPHA